MGEGDRNRLRIPILLPVLCSAGSILLSVCVSAIVNRNSGFRSILAGSIMAVPGMAGMFIVYYLVCRMPRSVPPGIPHPAGGTDHDRTAEPLEQRDGNREIESAEREEKIQKLCRGIAVRMRFAAPVLEELCTSISQSLSSTTEPISAELLSIRKSSTDFLQGIRSYEDEVRNHTAVIRLQDESALFDRDLRTLYTTVEAVFSELDGHIGNLKAVSEKIGGISDDITEISEQIRILSFNASIEAVRAGNAGKGFRVIAGEIKRLSSGTGERLGEIHNTLKETQRIFGQLGTGLKENRDKMLHVVTQRQSGFSEFEQTLEAYFPKLENLYTGVTEIIDSLAKSMDIISPVVQLHEITSQEIGNMGRVTADLCTWTEGRAETVCGKASANPDMDEIGEMTANIRKRLTTEKELNALGRGIRKTSPDADMDLGIDDREIELF